MLIELVERDSPRSFFEKIPEFLARPPQPVLRFYGSAWWEGNTLHMKVRNGTPLPLLYGLYVEADGGYREKTDHIGPFCTDDWSITFERKPSRTSVKLGLVPFEIKTDQMEITT